MSAQNRTQDKAAQPADLENKSLEPTTETKVAAAPGVKVTLTAHVSPGYIDGEEHVPGETVTVDEQLAHNLVVAGAAVR